jgi:dephospho-CoA kinase
MEHTVTRICITGGPRTGKTTLSDTLARELAERNGQAELRHTDAVMHHGWFEASALVALWLDEPGQWIIEGVAVSRALRKWREAHPGERPPVDRVIYLAEPHNTLSKGQATMAKGVRTVHDEIEGWLEEHGITTEYM